MLGTAAVPRHLSLEAEQSHGKRGLIIERDGMEIKAIERYLYYELDSFEYGAI